MLFKLSNLNSNLALTLSYLNPALNNSAQKFNFCDFTPQVRLFFIEKREPKISGLINVMERGIRKILTFVIHVH